MSSSNKRTIPQQMPHDWEPPVPAWSSDNHHEHIFIAYYGIQTTKGKDAQEVKEFQNWISTVTSTDCDYTPLKCEYAEYTDAQGYYTWLLIGYWNKADDHEQWGSNTEFKQYWNAPERLTAAAGVFRELLSIPAERFENLFSHESIDSGSADVGPGHHCKKLVREHNYWGGMRDRIALSGTDPMNADAPQHRSGNTNTQGKHLTVNVPLNCAVIRSGQNFEQVGAEELARFKAEVEPYFAEGMAFLSQNYDSTGCYSCRVLTETDAQGSRQKKTFGLVHFVSLKHLEEWAKSHPTHLRIFNSFIQYATELGADMQLRLWHEVATIPEQNPLFEYLNCHHKTGLLEILPYSEV
ncbi:phenylacetaldoxime dehydratase family protein [Amphritea atlantica]|uniref:Phenylacetaldoxime dehydratase family protein n=1 Tax=Amphritea atlantica TaxID=355243 RepID=A0ABY5GWD6_9GAMM|nr:phenylacetaldoxime dehydratase family protein [Amphritea atlantica]